MKKKIILSSVLAIVMCMSMIVGGTFALFTSDAPTNIAVTSGTVKVVATIDTNKIEVYSPTSINEDGSIANVANAASGLTFKNGGTVSYDGSQKLTLTNITPGDKVDFNIDVDNQSNVTIQYRVVISATNALNGLVMEINDKTYTGAEVETAWTLVGIGAEIESIPVSIELPATAGNTHQNKTTELTVTVEAVQGNTNTGEEVKNATVATVEQLKEILTTFTDAGSGNGMVSISNDIALAEGETWTPITVDGYNGAGVITINGNGHTISGLNAPLFAGGFAGASGIEIKDLTIADSEIVSTNNLGSGAFIETIDSMPTITLTDCHVKNSTITGSRTGGLIGWNSGYDNINDGSVKTIVTIENCSVVGCTITGAGTVGGIVGHAGANAWTWNNINNCTVEDCTLISNDDSYRVGAIVGTANIGHVAITDCTSTNNTIKQNNNGTEISRPEGQSELFGRTSLGTTGSLTIDGTEIN